MIELTKLDNTIFILNCQLIECVEEKPDTTITMSNGKKYIVKENTKEIVAKVMEYKKRMFGI
jgi:flagellar protein FlbD